VNASMKTQGIIINVLIAVVAVLAGHIFWPASPTADREAVQPVVSSPPPVPSAQVPPQLSRPPAQSPASLITPDIRAKFDKAREEAFAANPKLKTDEDDLNKERQALMKQNPPASPEDRTALMAKWKEHAQTMRDAMAKADPSLQAIFADLDAKIKARQQQQLAQFHSTPFGSTNAASGISASPSVAH
jgi:hypothetical protein